MQPLFLLDMGRYLVGRPHCHEISIWNLVESEDGFTISFLWEKSSLLEENSHLVDPFLDCLDDVQILYLAVPVFKVGKHLNEIPRRLHEVQGSDYLEDGVAALVDLSLSEVVDFLEIIKILYFQVILKILRVNLVHIFGRKLTIGDILFVFFVVFLDFDGVWCFGQGHLTFLARFLDFTNRSLYLWHLILFITQNFIIFNVVRILFLPSFTFQILFSFRRGYLLSWSYHRSLFIFHFFFHLEVFEKLLSWHYFIVNLQTFLRAVQGDHILSSELSNNPETKSSINFYAFFGQLGQAEIYHFLRLIWTVIIDSASNSLFLDKKKDKYLFFPRGWKANLSADGAITDDGFEDGQLLLLKQLWDRV